MQSRRSIVISLAAMLILACSCPLLSTPVVPTQPVMVQTSVVVVTATALSSLPTLTAEPTLTPTIAPSPTPSFPYVTPVSANVNCRAGPDVAYDAVSTLFLGELGQIAGRDEDHTWWYIRDPHNAGKFCWVAASVVTAHGDLSAIPIISPPAAIVTDVTVAVSVPSTVHCVGPNAVEFSGSITTNGETKVKFRWEITGDSENTTSAQTITFNKAATKDAPDPGAYKVDCGNYTVTLHVLSPNDVSASKKFKVKP
jgi:SH3-like domain-containing protein